MTRRQIIPRCTAGPGGSPCGGPECGWCWRARKLGLFPGQVATPLLDAVLAATPAPEPVRDPEPVAAGKKAPCGCGGCPDCPPPVNENTPG